MLRSLMMISLAVVLAGPAARAAAPIADAEAVRSTLLRQAADWNRGDLDAFAAGYKNSPDTLFIGRSVRRGYDGMLAGYRKSYPNREAMGQLTFSNIEVHLLDARFAAVIGNFHLERGTAGGGNADGIYSLVLEKTVQGWKIVLDHTTDTPVPPK